MRPLEEWCFYAVYSFGGTEVPPAPPQTNILGRPGRYLLLLLRCLCTRVDAAQTTLFQPRRGNRLNVPCSLLPPTCLDSGGLRACMGCFSVSLLHHACLRTHRATAIGPQAPKCTVLPCRRVALAPATWSSPCDPVQCGNISLARIIACHAEAQLLLRWHEAL